MPSIASATRPAEREAAAAAAQRTRQIAQRVAIGLAVLSLAACAHRFADETTPDPAAPFTLRLIGQRTLDHRLQFGGTTVGGLSGIDHDPRSDLYYLISDDRSAFAPARFYTARLTIEAGRFVDVALQAVVTLRRADGSPYPAGASDAEAIRYDARTRTLLWTSEGQRTMRRDGTADLIDPFIRRNAPDGGYVDDVPLDPMFHITAEPRGPRDNLVFEGATLTLDGESLWVSMEAPLLQDGPLPTMDEGAWSRFSRHDRTADGGFGPLRLQVAYPIDRIPSDGAWTAAHALNGVSEILAFDDHRMLVLERAFVLGAGWRVRLFEADWREATDVGAVDSLAGDLPRSGIVPMTKHLVLDFDTLGIRVDNLEGLCFGPMLADGHRTLVLVSDDNFNPGQVTQFLAFEIVPR